MAGETATAADGTHPTEMHSCFTPSSTSRFPFSVEEYDERNSTHFAVRIMYN